MCSHSAHKTLPKLKLKVCPTRGSSAPATCSVFAMPCARKKRRRGRRAHGVLPGRFGPGTTRRAIAQLSAPNWSAARRDKQHSCCKEPCSPKTGKMSASKHVKIWQACGANRLRMRGHFKMPPSAWMLKCMYAAGRSGLIWQQSAATSHVPRATVSKVKIWHKIKNELKPTHKIC